MSQDVSLPGRIHTNDLPWLLRSRSGRPPAFLPVALRSTRGKFPQNPTTGRSLGSHSSSFVPPGVRPDGRYQRGPWTQDEDRQILAMMEEHATWGFIRGRYNNESRFRPLAQKFGRSYHAVKKRACILRQRHGVKPRHVFEEDL